MSDANPEKANPEEQAFRQAYQRVGEFLYHFALLEREMDEGIGKLLGLQGCVIDIVTANIDFFRKLKILYSAEFAKAAMPDESRKKLLKQTWDAISSLNNDRVMMAHYPFSPGKPSGVVFRKAVAIKQLKVEDIEWSDEKFHQAIGRLTTARESLRKIIDEIVPYTPKLDFSDPRNSMYICML